MGGKHASFIHKNFHLGAKNYNDASDTGLALTLTKEIYASGFHAFQRKTSQRTWCLRTRSRLSQINTRRPRAKSRLRGSLLNMTIVCALLHPFPLAVGDNIS